MKRWAVAALVLLAGCANDEPLVDLTAGPPNVVVFVLDTFRADHIGAYGNTEVRTPNLDAFAAEAILFEDASSTSTWTLPSVASLYTGREPQHHGAIGAEYARVDEAMPVLAEILGTRGYDTWGFVAVDFLTQSFGMHRGFHRFWEYLTGAVSVRLREYEGLVAGILTVPPSPPWMGLIHYFDAHDPYRPPPPFDRMYYEGDPYAPPADPSRRIDVIHGPTNRIQFEAARRYAWLEGVQDIEFPVKQYAAGITYLDRHLGSVFERMRKAGNYDDSIIVILADHGEHLTEHDVYFTHRLPYAEVLHVPLMIRLPGGVQGGRRVSDPVSLVDVLPTLMELIGEPLETPVDGVSLVPALRGRRLDDRLLFAEYGSDAEDWAKSVWNDEWRYTEIRLEGATTTELFDRRRDPREERDVIDEHPEVAATFRAALDAHFGTERRRIAAEGERTPVQIDAETRERLRALGYID